MGEGGGQSRDRKRERDMERQETYMLGRFSYGECKAGIAVVLRLSNEAYTGNNSLFCRINLGCKNDMDLRDGSTYPSHAELQGMQRRGGIHNGCP